MEKAAEARSGSRPSSHSSETDYGRLDDSSHREVSGMGNENPYGSLLISLSMYKLNVRNRNLGNRAFEMRIQRNIVLDICLGIRTYHHNIVNGKIHFQYFYSFLCRR